MIRRAVRSTSWHGVPTVRRGHGGLLRLVEHGVGVGELGRRLAREHAARGVAAVTGHRAAEVAQHDLPGADHAVTGVVVRAGGVLPGGDDGEVDLVVALGQQPGRDVGRHLGLGPPDEGDVTGVQLVGDPVGGRTGGTQGGDLRGVLDHPQRPDDVDGAAERRAVEPRQQFDEEPGPHLVTDRRRRRAAGEIGDDRRRVLGLLPRAQREHARLIDDTGRLEPGDDHRRLAIAGHDEHRQPLERHRLVAGEVRQVVTDRQQQHVDALIGHRLAHPVEAVEVARSWPQSATGQFSGDLLPPSGSEERQKRTVTGVTASAADLAW